MGLNNEQVCVNFLDVEMLNNLKRVAFSAGLFVILFGCSGPNRVTPSASDPDYQVYLKLCKTLAGDHLYETVDNVRGIIDLDGCRYCEKVGHHGYDFVERHSSGQDRHYNTEYLDPNSSNFKHSAEFGDIYQYTLEAENHPDCSSYYNFYEERYIRGIGYPPRHRGRCISIKKIKKPAAKYMVERVVSVHPESKLIDQTRIIFSNADRTKIYAEKYSFRFTPKNPSTNFYTGYRNDILDCPDFSPKAFKVFDVFKPPKRPIVYAYVGHADVVDGDTVRIGGKEIHLWGVDAFEDGQICPFEGKDWACGQASKDALIEFVQRGEMFCQDYGPDGLRRILGFCHINGEDPALHLVQRGLAFAQGNVTDFYLQAYHIAEKEKVGLWKIPHSSRHNMMPWLPKVRPRIPEQNGPIN